MRHSPQSEESRTLLEMFSTLQGAFATLLEGMPGHQPHGTEFRRVPWLRDGGRHGGGERLALRRNGAFDNASLNVSCVHYDDLPDRKLASATALSCIVHPAHALSPSLHMHTSWTALKSGSHSWRLMCDLNPATPHPPHTERFVSTVREIVGERFEHGAAQGDQYFFIPALKRHRGAAHFYLEGHRGESWESDKALVQSFVEAVSETYAALVRESHAWEVHEAERRAQLEYHTIYLFQVLTMDRGTTSGLLAHQDNDLGILGSLPSRAAPALLRRWVDAVPEAQQPLVQRIAETLGDAPVVDVDDAMRLRLVQVVREHYRANPEALAHQARGFVLPPTVANHRGKGAPQS